MKIEMLEQQLQRERQALDREQEIVADLQRRLDRSEERVLALTMEAKADAGKEAQRGWWGRLLGR